MNKTYASLVKLLIVIAIIASFSCFIIGSISAVKKYYKTRDYITTTGTYVSHKEISRDTDEDGTNVTYSVIYEYTVDNQTYQYEGYISGTPPFKIDKVKEIYYDANNPKEAILGGFDGYQGNIFAIFFGFFFTITPIAFLTEKEPLKKVLTGIVVICFIVTFAYFFIEMFKNANYFPIVFFTTIFLAIFIKSRKYRQQRL